MSWIPLNERLQITERREGNLSPETDRTSLVMVGHAEGMPLAFANICKDLAETISAVKENRVIEPEANLYHRANDGLRSMAAVVGSGKNDGAWLDARPPMIR